MANIPTVEIPIVEAIIENTLYVALFSPFAIGLGWLLGQIPWIHRWRATRVVLWLLIAVCVVFTCQELGSYASVYHAGGKATFPHLIGSAFYSLLTVTWIATLVFGRRAERRRAER